MVVKEDTEKVEKVVKEVKVMDERRKKEVVVKEVPVVESLNLGAIKKVVKKKQNERKVQEVTESCLVPSEMISFRSDESTSAPDLISGVKLHLKVPECERDI